MRWEPKRAVNSLSMRALEARISRLWPWRGVKIEKLLLSGELKKLYKIRNSTYY
jgi:hypothetical protein